MIYVTGDCHGNFRRFQSDCFPEQANMTKDDTVIITGDCGGVWFGDSRDDETLDWLERLPFTLAFVCGNHEWKKFPQCHFLSSEHIFHP